MKKILSVLLSIVSVFTVFAFSACGDKGDVTVKYYQDASALLPALKEGDIAYGVLAEPAASNLEKMTKDTKTWYRLDIQELYDAETKNYPQAVMLVKESVLNTYPQLITDMKTKFADNTTWVAENAAQAITEINEVFLPAGNTSTLKAAMLNANVIANCNISWQSAQDAKKSVKEYLNSIIAIEKISASAATDDFFYDGTAAGDFTADKITVYAPDGAPALAIAKFIADNENFGTGKNFEYHIVAADKINGIVEDGTGDIVILPVNAASKKYNANAADPYKLVSVITHGNLYLMCSENITANDLKDKTVGMFGHGNVPDLTFKVVLNKLGYKFI